MPRNPDGSYTLPNPEVAPGDSVSSAWANSTLADVAQTLEESLDRDGNGGMRAPLPFGDGSVSAPGITWSNEVSSGFYRAGVGDMRVSMLGSDVFRWINGVAQMWDTTIPGWANVLTNNSPGTVPDGDADGQVPVWQNGTSEWSTELLAAASVTYDPTGNFVITGTDVQAALDSADGGIAGFNSHIIDTSIHWDDAPVDGNTYNRRDGAWVLSIAGVSDHGALNGLGDDDHPQYLTNLRGDARYLGINATAADSTLWAGQTQVITNTDPGVYDANTIYFITEP